MLCEYLKSFSFTVVSCSKRLGLINQINAIAIGSDVKDGDRTKDTIDRVKVII